jgi:hypothetical protein
MSNEDLTKPTKELSREQHKKRHEEIIKWIKANPSASFEQFYKATNFQITNSSYCYNRQSVFKKAKKIKKLKPIYGGTSGKIPSFETAKKEWQEIVKALDTFFKNSEGSFAEYKSLFPDRKDRVSDSTFNRFKKEFEKSGKLEISKKQIEFGARRRISYDSKIDNKVSYSKKKFVQTHKLDSDDAILKELSLEDKNEYRYLVRKAEFYAQCANAILMSYRKAATII